MSRSWWWLLGLVASCVGGAAPPGKAPRSAVATTPSTPSSVQNSPPAASPLAAASLPRFEKVADGFGLGSGSPWGAVAATGARTLAVSDSSLANVIALLEFQGATAARQTLPSGFSSPVSVGGEWPRAWVAARFDFARQNDQIWQTHELALPSDTNELLAARSWLGGRVLGLFVPGDRYSGANLRGGVFAVIDGAAGGEPDLHAPSCQDCRSIFALDFAALPTGQVYVVGERDAQATLLEFLPTGGRGIYVPTPSFEPMSATYGPSGKVIALSPQEVYFGAGHRLPIVYRYDGHEAKALPVPLGLPATVEASNAGQPLAPVMGLAASAGGDLWAIFGTRTGFYPPGTPRSRLYRYERSGNWQQMSFPPGPDGQAPDLVDVAVSNDAVWVLGQFGDKGVLYRSALPVKVGAAPADALAPAAKKTSATPSYGSTQGSFSCAGAACSGEQVCCKFQGFERCVTPNAELPTSSNDFLSARVEIAKACRTDDFAEPPSMIGVCTASSDCGAGQLCVSPDSERMSIAHCAPAMPPDGTEVCREGQACAERGSVCKASSCVHGNAQVDCAGKACGTSEVCCPQSLESLQISCRKLDKCLQMGESGPAMLTCSSRQHCASGRRCLLGAWNASSCMDVEPSEQLSGVLCASDAECDVRLCAGSRKARCARDADSKIKLCQCPGASNKP